MGEGRQKLLMGFGGRTVIECVVAAASQSCVDEVVVVTGSHHDRIAELLIGGNKVVLTRNPDPSRGMLSSVRCGLEAVDSRAIGIAVLQGDQPGIDSEMIDAVIDAWRRSTETIAVPKFGERRGHPLVFDACYAGEVKTEFDDVGLRGLLAAHADDLLELPVSSNAILEDIDTPEDYERLVEDDGYTSI
jgi:molybdenum cofactor cytidylyltransferase